MKFYIYFIVLFIHSCFHMWLESATLFTIGSLNIYAVDIIYIFVLFVSARVILSGKIKIVYQEGLLYLVFLLWLCAEVLIGSTRYGFRAFGETRYVFNFVSFFVPFYIVSAKQRLRPEFLMDLIYKTLLCCAIASIIAYLFNIAVGNKNDFTDFRGVRYIGTSHTFYLSILFCFYVLKYTIFKSIKSYEMLLLILSIALAILSKNRAGLICPVAIASIFYAKNSNFKKIIYTVLAVVILLISLKLLTPSGLLGEVDMALSGALDPAADSTGRWRLAVQASALHQSLETFWLGQGYGGYFSFQVPGMNWDLPIEYPPHNQFLNLFLKTGIIGAFICVFTVLAFIYKTIKINKTIVKNSREQLYITLLTVVIASQLIYGQVYDFIPLYGLYYGFGILLIRAIRLKSAIVKPTSTVQTKLCMSPETR